MKKLIFILLLSVSFYQISACDICGCSSGNYFLGPTPQFNKHFIGIRYSFRSFKTVMKDDERQFSKDFYQTAELWGGVKLKKRFQVLVFVPFNVNQSVTDDGTKMSRGFGDITVIGNYKLFEKKSLTKDTLTVGQQLWIGGGVKLPTGQFLIDTSEIVSSANSQAGTGSVDFLLTASYSIVIDNLGFTSNVNYNINQAANDFKFGNRFTAMAFVFRSFQLKLNSLIPNIGVLFENLSPNELSETKIENTGGYALLGTVGLETRFDKITIGFNAQLPFASNISANQTKVNLRGMAHLTYAF